MWLLVLWIGGWISLGIYLYRWSKNNPNRGHTSPAFMGIAGGFLASCALLVVAASIAAVFAPKSDQEKAAEAAANAAAAVEDACESDWHKCTDNTMLVNKWDGLYKVTDACKQYADDQAHYGEPRFSASPFSTYETGKSYVDTGLVLLEDKGAEFQNGFGAMEHMEVQCLYDLNSEKVVDFSATPRE